MCGEQNLKHKSSSDQIGAAFHSLVCRGHPSHPMLRHEIRRSFWSSSLRCMMILPVFHRSIMQFGVIRGISNDMRISLTMKTPPRYHMLSRTDSLELATEISDFSIECQDPYANAQEHSHRICLAHDSFMMALLCLACLSTGHCVPAPVALKVQGP